MDWLIGLDKELLLLINGAHTPFWDAIMKFFSAIPVWIPQYLLIVGCLFIPKFYGPKSLVSKGQYPSIPHWLIATFAVLALILCFGLCDQVSYQLKEGTDRFRPSWDPTLVNEAGERLVRLIAGKSSQHGFPSGHATSSFGLAVLSSLLYRRRCYTIYIFAWAALVSYSRVYLGQHFPIDITCGAILGTLFALGVWYLLNFILKKTNNRLTNRK